MGKRVTLPGRARLISVQRRQVLCQDRAAKEENDDSPLRGLLLASLRPVEARPKGVEGKK